jgi:hypothetical protein
LKFADGRVKRYRESALPADKIGPLELYADAMAFLGYFECIRGERQDVVVPVDLKNTFQGLIERRHFACTPSAFYRINIGRYSLARESYRFEIKRSSQITACGLASWSRLAS